MAAIRNSNRLGLIHSTSKIPDWVRLSCHVSDLELELTPANQLNKQNPKSGPEPNPRTSPSRPFRSLSPSPHPFFSCSTVRCLSSPPGLFQTLPSLQRSLLRSSSWSRWSRPRPSIGTADPASDLRNRDPLCPRVLDGSCWGFGWRPVAESMSSSAYDVNRAAPYRIGSGACDVGAAGFSRVGSSAGLFRSSVRLPLEDRVCWPRPMSA